MISAASLPVPAHADMGHDAGTLMLGKIGPNQLNASGSIVSASKLEQILDSQFDFATMLRRGHAGQLLADLVDHGERRGEAGGEQASPLDVCCSTAVVISVCPYGCVSGCGCQSRTAPPQPAPPFAAPYISLHIRYRRHDAPETKVSRAGRVAYDTTRPGMLQAHGATLRVSRRLHLVMSLRLAVLMLFPRH